MPPIGDYTIVFAVAFAVTCGVTPLVRRVANARGWVTPPGPRKIHTSPIPELGGTAMMAGFMVALAAARLIPSFRPMFEGTTLPLGIIGGAVIIWLVGTVDDLHEVSPPAKTAGTVLAGSVLYLLGVGMVFFKVPFAGILVLSPDLAPLVTVVWVFVMAQAINLIDGLDGLAAGIVAIASGAFFLYGHRLAVVGVVKPDNPSSLIAVITLGLCLGFLPHNFHPARIMMGDGGALLLGLLMAVSTMLVGGQTDDPFSGRTFFFYAPLFIPLVILGVPILDTAFAIVRRATRRSGMATADKDHLHHRLIRLGHGQRRAVLILWAWTALLSGFVLYPAYTGKGNNAIVPIGVAAFGLLLYTYFHPGVRRARGDQTGGEEEPRERG
ncbi:MAG TPA: MraY family glycosyltransferase [Acidimicrobiales bacterium]|jgi:UDP-GlcNAc:undecaprenyl-phosphate GlcNAc-1-phosphate transferase|nr:MraY family glycosyltransferase [Acidimicrobiales bacterium]